jgi:hypothetical protein
MQFRHFLFTEEITYQTFSALDLFLRRTYNGKQSIWSAMQNKLAISVVAIWVILAVLTSPFFAHACTIIPQSVEVGSEFRVRVMNQGRPVKGLRLVLSKNNSTLTNRIEKIGSFTDTEGYAYFSNLNPGSFWLAPDRDAGVGDALVVDVSPGNPKSATIPLDWPSRAPLTVGSAGGVIRAPNYYPDQTQTPLSISLLEGVSGREIETTETDSNGRFKFTHEIAPGIYFVRLNPSNLRAWSGEQIQGMIAIEIAHDAKQGALDLDLGWSSCGLSYAQSEVQTELNVDEICGSAADSEGAAVSNAQVILLDGGEGAKILKRTTSGTNGEFALLDIADGKYKLLLKSPGFRPFLRVIHVHGASTAASCQQPLRVRLDMIF